MVHAAWVYLVLVLATLAFVQAHSWCGHAEARQKYVEYKAQEAPGASSRLKADAIARRAKSSTEQRQLVAEQSPQGLRVVYDYQLLPGTSQNLVEYIQDVLMPAAAAVLKRAMRVCDPKQHVCCAMAMAR